MFHKHRLLNSPICTWGRQQRPGARVGERKEKKSRNKSDCNTRMYKEGKKTDPLVSQPQMELTCVATAKAGVKWKGNSRAVDGDPAIPPPSSFSPQGLSATCWALASLAFT